MDGKKILRGDKYKAEIKASPVIEKWNRSHGSGKTKQQGCQPKLAMPGSRYSKRRSIWGANILLFENDDGRKVLQIFKTWFLPVLIYVYISMMANKMMNIRKNKASTLPLLNSLISMDWFVLQSKRIVFVLQKILTKMSWDLIWTHFPWKNLSSLGWELLHSNYKLLPNFSFWFVDLFF